MARISSQLLQRQYWVISRAVGSNRHPSITRVCHRQVHKPFFIRIREGFRIGDNKQYEQTWANTMRIRAKLRRLAVRVPISPPGWRGRGAGGPATARKLGRFHFIPRKRCPNCAIETGGFQAAELRKYAHHRISTVLVRWPYAEHR